MAPTDLKIKIIRLVLEKKLNPEALKSIAKEYGCTAQYIRQIVRDCVSFGYIEKYTITPEGREYLERETGNE